MCLNEHINLDTKIGFLVLVLSAIGCTHPSLPKESLGTIGVATWQGGLPDQEKATTSDSSIMEGILFIPKEIAKRTVAFSVGVIYGCVEGIVEPSEIKRIPLAGGGSNEQLEVAALRLLLFLSIEAAYCGVRGTTEGFSFTIHPEKRYERVMRYERLKRYEQARKVPSVEDKLNVSKEEIRRRIFVAIQGNTTESVQMLDDPMDYDQLSAQGIDTVLNLRLEELSKRNSVILNRRNERGFYIKINVRLINTKDKKEIYTETFDHSFSVRKMTTGQLNSQRVTQELESAYQNLSEQVVAKIFQ